MIELMWYTLLSMHSSAGMFSTPPLSPNFYTFEECRERRAVDSAVPS